MIFLSDKSRCCGCQACLDACQAGAIVFSEDDAGFPYPEVDESKCVHCGQCERVCPCCDAGANRVDVDVQQAFVAVHKNLPTRFASASGGVFSALANAIYRQGGFVGGAVWTEDFGVRHVLSDDPSDLLKIRGLKYGASDLRGFYLRVREVLAAGRPVLVCGTPCQISALRLFLVEMPENLYLVDFLCSGISSPRSLLRYRESMEKTVGSKVISFRFRTKELGWRQRVTKLMFKSGKVIYDPSEVLLRGDDCSEIRPSCQNCKFSGRPHSADVTIADCWVRGIGQDPLLDQDLGTSGVLVNNAQGARLWQLAAGSLCSQSLAVEAVLANSVMSHSRGRSPTCKNGLLLRLRRYLGRCRRLMNSARSFGSWRFILDNPLRDLIAGRPMVFTRRGVHLDVLGRLELADDIYVGKGFHPRAPLMTSIRIAAHGRLSFGGFASISYGADIEVLDGGSLEIGDGAIFNLGSTIVCGCRIVIGKNVSFGRHITVRDNNGGHFTNLPGYKNDIPVEIGDHVWICEGATILPGVKIGAGAIVGAKAVVTSNVPANTLVMGNPAKVVAEGVEWKD